MSHTPTAARTKPQPTVRWLLGGSSWMLLVLMPNGVLAWLGFAIIGALARKGAWGVAATIYGLAAIITAQIDTALGDILQGVLFLVTLVHALIINPVWLNLLWSRRENGLSITGVRVPRKAPVGPRQRAAQTSPEAERLLGGSGTDRSDYLAGPSPAESARPKRRTRAQRKAEAAAEREATVAASSRTTTETSSAATSAVRSDRETDTELVDVNTANQRTIAKLPGLDRGTAKAAVAERSKRGGFASLEDFASTAGLQPHEIVRLRAAAFCSPRPRAARGFGRRVDF